MSFLSEALGGGAQDAANSQINGLINGETIATGFLGQNPGIINSLGGQALQPFQQNQATAQQGIGALGNLLGLNGAAGSQSAMTQLQTTPGYQFSLGQGDNAINASAAAGGTLNSGNQLTALSNYNQGLAQNTYQSAVSNLNPYLGLSENSASGAAGVLGGETSALTGNNNLLAQLGQSTAAGIGNAQASADLAQQSADSSLLGGALSLGGSLFGGAGGLSGLTSGLSGLFGGGAGSSIGAGLDGLSFLGAL